MVSGYSLELIAIPHQASLPKPVRFTTNLEVMVMDSIHDLEQKAAVKSVKPHPNQIISHIFLVPKNDESQRPVVNLKLLARFKFKMESVKSNRYLKISCR